MSTAREDWAIREPDFVAEVADGLLDRVAPPGTPPAARTELVLRLSGSADMSTRRPLEALIARLHGRIETSRIGSIRVDLRQLEFMSAASFNALVGWLSLIHDMPVEKRYRILFSSNPHIRWQRRSLGALQCFATDVVSIEG